MTPFNTTPPMSTDLNKFLFKLYSIRRSAWGLALLINNADISFPEAYNIERINLITNYAIQVAPVHQLFFTLRIGSKAYEQKMIKLNDFAKKGFDQWCRSFTKPKPHVVSQAMSLAAKEVGIPIAGGKVKGAPGCILNIATYKYGDTVLSPEPVWVPDNGR